MLYLSTCSLWIDECQVIFHDFNATKFVSNHDLPLSQFLLLSFFATFIDNISEQTNEAVAEN